jgi:hypothetical protein
MEKFALRAGLALLASLLMVCLAPAQAQAATGSAGKTQASKKASTKSVGKTKVRQKTVKPARSHGARGRSFTANSSQKTLTAEQRERAQGERQADSSAAQSARSASSAKP